MLYEVITPLRRLVYLLASLLTATAVTLAGSIGFVGLIVPHMLRLPNALAAVCTALITCAAASRWFNARITSYNVCYTKLLR